MTALVFPIGQYGGATGPPGSPATTFPVRVGQHAWPLDTTDFTVWAYAHGLPDRVGIEPWTVTALIETLAANGVADGGRRLAELHGNGLTAQVDPADAEDFASRHRLVPLLWGLGENADDQGGYPLGLLDRPMTAIAGPLYAIWSWSDVEPDLWSACRGLAEDARALGGGDPDLTQPDRVLWGLLGGLSGLLAIGAAYLDVVVRP
jgi:hypothetical protein